MRGRVSVDDQGPDFPKESSVELRCLDAFAAVSHFERTHCLALQVRVPSMQYGGTTQEPLWHHNPFLVDCTQAISSLM